MGVSRFAVMAGLFRISCPRGSAPAQLSWPGRHRVSLRPCQSEHRVSQQARRLSRRRSPGVRGRDPAPGSGAGCGCRCCSLSRWSSPSPFWCTGPTSGTARGRDRRLVGQGASRGPGSGQGVCRRRPEDGSEAVSEIDGAAQRLGDVAGDADAADRHPAVLPERLPRTVRTPMCSCGAPSADPVIDFRPFGHRRPPARRADPLSHGRIVTIPDHLRR